MTDKENALALLKDAKQLIVDKGWAQKRSWNYADNAEKILFCTIGAMGVANWDEVTNQSRYGINAVGAACKIFSKANNLEYIAAWNDTPGRTVEEVLIAFDKAIALSEQEAKL
jgi:hypothetical protein